MSDSKTDSSKSDISGTHIEGPSLQDLELRAAAALLEQQRRESSSHYYSYHNQYYYYPNQYNINQSTSTSTSTAQQLNQRSQNNSNYSGTTHECDSNCTTQTPPSSWSSWSIAGSGNSWSSNTYQSSLSRNGAFGGNAPGSNNEESWKGNGQPRY